jgi:deoxyribonuclease V
MATWSATVHELTQLQHALAEMTPERWQPPANVLRIGACFVCFEPSRELVPQVTEGSPGSGDPSPPAAGRGERQRARRRILPANPARPPRRTAARACRARPADHREVLIVNATGDDHTRRAGLAFHLGAVLGLPTVGVTTRPLVAQGAWPVDQP